MIYGKLTVHDRQTDRQTDKVYVEITRKALAHAQPKYFMSTTFFELAWEG